MGKKRRILSVKDGVPNFIRAAKYATIASLFTSKSEKGRYPYRRRSRRSEGAMFVLAYLSAASEELEEDLRIESVSKDVREKIDKNFSRLYPIIGTDDKDKIIRLASETISVIKLANKRKHILDSRFLDAFGGYGTFARCAASLGIPVAYVELNPVAFFFFRTTVKGLPEGLEKAAAELLSYLELACSRYYTDAYATFHARLIKCPKCGSHVPLIAKAKGRSYYYYYIGRKKKEYLLEPKRDGDERRFDVLECSGCGRESFICPACATEIELKKEDFSRLYKEALKEANVPRAYITPALECGKTCREADRKKFLEAIEELEASREELKKYIPYEEIPKSSSRKEPKIEDVKARATHRTHLMSPRQILCYAEAMKYIDENYEGSIKHRLAMLLINTLRFNVLINFNKNARPFEISLLPAYYVPITPTELSIPGPKSGRLEGTFRSIFSNIREYAYMLFSLGDAYMLIYPGIKLVEDLPNSGEVLAINEAAQKIKLIDELEEAFDFAFLDPPYLYMVVYRDLSALLYVMLKRLLGEPLPGTKYTLEEIKKYDLTSDDVDEFVEKFRDALEGISYALKPDGFAVLQFPSTSKLDFYEVRTLTIALAIQVGLFPAIAAGVLPDRSKLRIAIASSRSVPVLSLPNTFFILLLKEELFDEYLESLGIEVPDKIYIKDVEGSKEEVEEYIRNYINSGALDPLLENIVSLGIRLEEAIAIGSALASAIVAKVADTDFEELRELIAESSKMLARRIASKVAADILQDVELTEEDFDSRDLSRIYLLGLAYYELDLQLLSTAFKNISEEIEGKRRRGRLFTKNKTGSGNLTPITYVPRPINKLAKSFSSIPNENALIKTVLKNFSAYLEGETVYRPRGTLRRYARALLKVLEKYRKSLELRMKGEELEKEVIAIENLENFLKSRLSKVRKG